MILTDNIIILKKRFPDVWSKLKVFEETRNDSQTKVILAKNGLPTIMINNGQEQYLHSKYDPQNEAVRFVSQYQEDEMEKYRHVFFYGCGMGYHVAEFMRRFSEKTFTLYEPNPFVFLNYLSTKNFQKLPLKQLANLYIEFEPTDSNNYLQKFVGNINKEILFVTLPSYERVFPSQYQRFNREFIQYVKNKKTSLNTNLAYEKLWTLNSMINFSEVARTPNILHDIDKSHFDNKPALLVAAGPSLEEEINNLKIIKEKGLAYIFAVGSSIKALIANNIHPDAVCTYDPTTLNRFTYKEVIESNITDIPFIFGSSVGFETVKKYPGPKMHMIINQDTVAPYYLSHPSGKLDKLSDAPSIAVVTIELLNKLGCNPIILVGQNFAVKNDKWYAKGIYDEKAEQLSESAKKTKENALTVEDVYGEQVYTEESFNRMRGQMEYYIKTFPQVKVINTTKGGAKIAGADFVPLEEFMKDFLRKKVVTHWLSDNSPGYSKEYQIERAKLMEKSYEECGSLFAEVVKILVNIERQIIKGNPDKIDRLINKFDKYFKKLIQNIFLKVFLIPMNRVRYEILSKSVADIRLETNSIEKARNVEKNFGAFIYDCKRDMELIKPYFKAIQKEIMS